MELYGLCKKSVMTQDHDQIAGTCEQYEVALYRIKNANSSTRKELDVGVDETCQLHVVKTVIGVGIDIKYIRVYLRICITLPLQCWDR